MVSFEEIQTSYYMIAATGVLLAIYYVYKISINQRTMKKTLETRQTARAILQVFL